MRRTAGAGVLAFGLFLSCTGGSPAPGDATNHENGPATDVDAAIRQVMYDQVTAWNRGDIRGFMEGYADSVCFVSPKGRTCGKEAVTANYSQHYPDQAAMGILHFSDLEVLAAGERNAWCTGQWRLERHLDTLGGGFSLLWAHDPAGWRIVRDHTY